MTDPQPDPVPALTDPPVWYADWLADLRARIHLAQQRAALAVNTELLELYWRIGRDILGRQAERGWGSKVVDRLAHDLREAFPDMRGFSARNLKYMRAFAQAWPDESFVQQAVAQIPWGHNIVLLTKLKDADQRLAYAGAAADHVWSRNVLEIKIDARTLDLLFYHLRLRCNVVIEIKAGKFKPEHMGQLGFYMTAVDAQVKHPQDAPTIGLLLCRTKNEIVAEYALRDNSRPLGIAEHQLLETLPTPLQTNLPTIEQLERELGEVRA